ncbi:RHS repeat-associated core domain-containing protein [Taibaiella sp. KBW10]|uniref:RHS repeat-associated core domain-containing protein n=1 Tax=Taibaiella sp. KBW10 TaxID=2153357 RepID=UPI0013155AE6|nr:RHS repeat-associated core domain-containing protein [Taibaiella sp. KBW10]
MFNNISHTPVVSTEPGYVIVYVDNRNIGTDVWFDNVQVSHYSGQVLEEDHYYPFGLAITENNNTISTPQPYKYQGKELEKGFGLEMYDFSARMVDPQLARTWQLDPHADRYTHISPYGSMNNSPINYIDPNGKDATMTFDKATNTLTISAKVYFQGKDLPKGNEARAEYMKQINADLQSTFKGRTGTEGDLEYTVKFDVTAEINETITKGDLKTGENIMVVDNENAGLNQPGGGKRPNVQGNMGYIQNTGGNVAVHEMGHMFGLRDRYTDYMNSKNQKEWSSFTHEGFKNDLMGRSKLNLVQTHYNDYVHYYDFKVNQGQKHLLPPYRSSTLKVPSGGVGVINSSVAEGDIPSGWIKR